MKKVLLKLWLLCLLANPLSAEGPEGATPSPAILVAKVTTHEGQPAAGVRVSLVGLPWSAVTDEQGQAQFLLRPGPYVLEATSSSGMRATASVLLSEGQPVTVELRLETATFHEEVVVSGARPRQLREAPQAASALSDEALRLQAAPSLGETLRQQPGVRSTFYAPGASRPLIRGLGGDRIRLLQNGLDVGDASETSPDHGVALESFTLERVEVLRGPAALLYSTGGLGGVVNAQNGTVPQETLGLPLAGTFLASAGSNDGLRAAYANVAGQQGQWLWQASGGTRRSDDYRTPLGQVANSFTRADDATLGFSLLSSSGLLGVGLDQHETRYGSVVEENVWVGLWRRRLELAAQLWPKNPTFRQLRLSLAWVDYHHTEFEGETPGTQVRNRLVTGRLEAQHQLAGFSGIVGLEWRRRDLAVAGEETYLPRTLSQVASLFLWEHRELGPFQWELAARWDTHQHRPAGFAPERRFGFASAAASLATRGISPWQVSVGVSYSGKAPNAEELYSFGPHAATGLFEVGNPAARLERTASGELGLAYRHSSVQLQANLFLARVQHFTYQQLTGEERVDLPVALFTQADSTFRGGELAAHLDLLHREENHLELTLGADWVEAEKRSGEALPRIPPLRLLGELAFTQPGWRASLLIERVFPATRLAVGETRTPGYTQVEASFFRRWLRQKLVHFLGLRGQNLTDIKAYNHLAFFKGRNPLPGRRLTLVYQLWF